MKNKKLLAIMFMILLSACASPDEAIENYSMPVPSYATSESIVEAAQSILEISNKTHRTYYTAKDKSDEAALGLVAILVPYSELNRFSDRVFVDYGQKCEVDPSHLYKLNDGMLTVSYDASTGIDSFEKFCDSQIPDTINSYYITLRTGDDEDVDTNMVGWEMSPLPIIAKFNK